MNLFLNQMLYMNPTKGDVLTEAHHVDAKGNDGGVVYNEMLVMKPLIRVIDDDT